MAISHCNFLFHKVRPSSTNPFPLGETFGHPFSPFPCRWSRAQQVAGHYFRPGFVSLPPPSPSLPIYLRSALQSVARPVQLPESSYMGRRGLHDTARARASPHTA